MEIAVTKFPGNLKAVPPNNGNYLGILELIAKYDAFLAEHIRKHANKGSGHVNYFHPPFVKS